MILDLSSVNYARARDAAQSIAIIMPLYRPAVKGHEYGHCEVAPELVPVAR